MVESGASHGGDGGLKRCLVSWFVKPRTPKTLLLCVLNELEALSVPDEPKGISRATSEGAGVTLEIILTNSDAERTKSEREVAKSEKFDDETTNDEAQDNVYVHDEKHDADERINDENTYQEMGDVEKIATKKTEKGKANGEQAKDDKTKDDQVGDLVSVTQKKKPEALPSCSNCYLSSNYAPLLDVLVSVIPPQTTLTTPLPTQPIISEALTVTTTIPDSLL
nr:hypothetical protein [Tanacetum cinerariifolium]